MDTFKSSKPQKDNIEQFLDSLENAETVNDVPIEELEEGEAAYQKYLEGCDRGKTLEQLKAELDYSA
ncbi:unknown protein [Stanieria sp. NIES-3757]|nr:unknown protein [Stanieria sp. NIES-3757]